MDELYEKYHYPDSYYVDPEGDSYDEVDYDEEDKLARKAGIICPHCGASGWIRLDAVEHGDPAPADWQRCGCHWGRDPERSEPPY